MAAIVENQGQKQIRAGGIFAFMVNQAQVATKAWLTMGFHNFMALRILVNQTVIEIAKERGDTVNFITNEIIATERQLAALKFLKNHWDTKGQWTTTAKDNKTWIRFLLVFQPNCNDKAPEMIGYSYFGDIESNLIKSGMGVESTSQTTRTQVDAPIIAPLVVQPPAVVQPPVQAQAVAPVVSAPAEKPDLQTMLNETKAMVETVAKGQSDLAEALKALLASK